MVYNSEGIIKARKWTNKTNLIFRDKGKSIVHYNNRSLWKIRIQFSVFSLLPALKKKTTKQTPIRVFLESVVFASGKFKPQMLLLLACINTARKNVTKSLTSTPHKRMNFSFKILRFTRDSLYLSMYVSHATQRKA